jgi:hypothetical protein
LPVIIAILAALLALSPVSIEAAPLLPANAGSDTLGTAPPIRLVADGCGYGYWRTRWQDQWGYWHWGRCVSKTWGKGAFLPPAEPAAPDWSDGMKHR